MYNTSFFMLATFRPLEKKLARSRYFFGFSEKDSASRDELLEKACSLR